MPELPKMIDTEKGLKELDQFIGSIRKQVDDAYFTDLHSVLNESYNLKTGDLLVNMSFLLDRMQLAADQVRTK